MKLSFLAKKDKSNYVYINRFMYNITKYKNKNHFWKNYVECFSNKKILTSNRNAGLKISGNCGLYMFEKGNMVQFSDFNYQLQLFYCK